MFDWFSTGLNKVSNWLHEVPGTDSHSEKKWDAGAKAISAMNYNPTQSTTLGGTGSGIDTSNAQEAPKTRMELMSDAAQAFKDADISDTPTQQPDFNVPQTGTRNIAPKLGAAPDSSSVNPYLQSTTRLLKSNISLMGGNQ